MTTDNPAPEIPAIEGMIRDGVEQGLRDLFDMPSSNVVFLASTDRMRIAKRLAEMKQGPDAKIAWPYLFVSIPTVSQGISDQLHGYNSRSLARHGRYLKVSDDQGSVLRVSLVPTVFEFELVYMVDDYQMAWKYSSRWISHSTKNRLNFSIDYGGQAIDIRCQMADSMSTPPRDESIDQPNVFEYTATVKVAGFVSDVIDVVPMVRGQQVRAAAPPQEEFRLHNNVKNPKVWSR